MWEVFFRGRFILWRAYMIPSSQCMTDALFKTRSGNSCVGVWSIFGGWDYGAYLCGIMERIS